MKVTKSQKVDIAVVLFFLLSGLVAGVIYSNWQKQMLTSSTVLYININNNSEDGTEKFYARSQSKDMTDSLNALFTSSEFISLVSSKGIDIPPKYAVKKLSPQLIRLSSTGADQAKITTDLDSFTTSSLEEVVKIDKEMDPNTIRKVNDHPTLSSSTGRILVNIFTGLLGGVVVAGVVLTIKNSR